MSSAADGPDFEELRDRGEKLREVGALAPGGELLAWARETAEAAWREWWREELSVGQAAEWSGYSEDHLRSMVSDGRLPDARLEARKGVPIRVRRCDLPRKPIHARHGGPRAGL